MKRFFILAVSIGMIVNFSYAQKNAKRTMQINTANSILKSRMDTIWYGYGMALALSFENLEKFDYKLNLDLMLEGLKDCLNNNTPKISLEKMKDILVTFTEVCESKKVKLQENERIENADKNLKEGIKFLLENKGKEGVKVTPSGLQYKVLSTGNNLKPQARDTAVFNFSGRSIDGNEFESSYKMGQPVKVCINDLFPGWKEALLLMDEGSKWQIYIPPDLAYGGNGYGPLGPNSVLVFDIELIKIITGK